MQARFLAEQEEQMALEMQSFERELEEERAREVEAARHKKDSLAQVKQDLVQQRREMMAADMRKRGTVSDAEKAAIMGKHQEELASLRNTLDAEKMRQTAALQEKMGIRRDRRRRAKQAEMQNQWAESMRAHSDEAREKERELQASVILSLKEVEAMHGITESPLPSVAEAATKTPETAAPESAASNSSASASRSRLLSIPEEKTGGRAASGAGRNGSLLSPAAPPTDEKMTSAQAQELLQRLLALEAVMVSRSSASRGGGGASGGAVSLVQISERDAEWRLEGTRALEVAVDQLTMRQFVVYQFGVYIIDMLVGLGYAHVTLALATRLPAPSAALANDYDNNSFRRSFLYRPPAKDGGSGRLVVRLERLQDAGEFLILLVHCMAHISVGELHDDRSPAFIREFHRALRVCGEDLIFGTGPNVDAIPSSAAMETRFAACATTAEKVAAARELLGLEGRTARARALANALGGTGGGGLPGTTKTLQ